MLQSTVQVRWPKSVCTPSQGSLKFDRYISFMQSAVDTSYMSPPGCPNWYSNRGHLRLSANPVQPLWRLLKLSPRSSTRIHEPDAFPALIARTTGVLRWTGCITSDCFAGPAQRAQPRSSMSHGCDLHRDFDLFFSCHLGWAKQAALEQ